jgi:hypothetical protein
MMKRVLFACLVLAAALSARAEYKFQVPQNRCVVTVNPDASVRVDYTITFANEGQPIDIIDVGLPDDQFDFGEITADLDGQPVTDVRSSTAVEHGVEVHIEDRAIPAGKTGTLHLSARLQNRVFADDKDPQYASLVFSPTWYGAEYTSGITHLACEFVLPEGVGPQEPRYHDLQFTSSRVEDGRVHYVWEVPQASPSRQYTFGASFPKRVMARLAEKPKGPTFGEKVAGFFALFLQNAFTCLCPTCFIAFLVFSIVQGRKRRLQYLPPSVGMEGTEVRRGLTVPEVAVLMQRPVDKVMALLLFGMIRKDLLKVVSRNPLKLEAIPGGTPQFTYETEFAKAVQDDGKVDQKEAVRIMADLIKRVQEKMKGFSRVKSVAYYKDIMTKAWNQVGSEDYSQSFEWLLLDESFGATAARRYGDRPMPIPIWWGSVLGPGHVGGGPATGGAPLPSPVSAANTIVSGLEGFGHDLVNSVPGLATAVTQQTNPVPVSSGGGHSGGGCACACACAGCACACAGGGR